MTGSDAPSGATLWLVRHGQSAWNVAGRIQGLSPAAGGLTGTGRQQAAAAARDLARQVPGAELIVASPLDRTAQTAEIIAGVTGLPIEYEPDLREHDLGDLHGTDSLTPDGVLVIDQFWDDPGRPAPGGESIIDLYDRVQRALRRWSAARPGADLIVVTHGGPVRVAMMSARPVAGTPSPFVPVGNATITAWPPAPGAVFAGTGAAPRTEPA